MFVTIMAWPSPVFAQGVIRGVYTASEYAPLELGSGHAKLVTDIVSANTCIRTPNESITPVYVF